MTVLASRHRARRLARVCAAAVTALALAFMALLLPVALFRTRCMSPGGYYGDVISIGHDNLYLNLIVLAMLCGALFIIYKLFEEGALRRLQMLMCTLALVFGLWFIGSAKLYPIYQMPGNIAASALSAARGDYVSALSNPMYLYYPKKLGCVMLYEWFTRLLRLVLPRMPDGYYSLAIQALQLLFLALGAFSLTEYTRLVHGEDSARLAALLMSFDMPVVLWCTVIDSLIPALGLLCAGLWLGELGRQEGRRVCAVLSALSLGACCALHPPLAPAAALVVLGRFLQALRERSVTLALSQAAAVLFALLLLALPKAYYSALADTKLPSGLPLVSYADIGLSAGYSGLGRFAPEVNLRAYQSAGYDFGETARAAVVSAHEKLKTLCSNAHDFISFFLNKLYNQFNEPECQSLWVNRAYGSYTQKGWLYTLVCESGRSFFSGAMACGQLVLYLGFALGLLWRLLKRSYSGAFTAAAVLAGFVLSLLMPAEPRYALPYIFLMYPLAARGLCDLFAALDRR